MPMLLNPYISFRDSAEKAMTFYRSVFALKHQQPALANGAAGGEQATLRTQGGDRVFAFTRTKDAGAVVVAVNFGDAAADVPYEGLGTPGEYTDWFDESKTTLGAAGRLTIPAHGYRVLVR